MAPNLLLNIHFCVKDRAGLMTVCHRSVSHFLRHFLVDINNSLVAHEAMKLGATESPVRASFAGARARSPLEDSANVINSYKATAAPGGFLITARDSNGHIHEVRQEESRAASPRRVASVMRIADSRLRRKNAKKNQMAKFVLHTDPRGQSTAGMGCQTEEGTTGRSEKQWGSEYQILEGDSDSAAGSPSFGALEFSPTHTGRAVLQLRSRAGPRIPLSTENDARSDSGAGGADSAPRVVRRGGLEDLSVNAGVADTASTERGVTGAVLARDGVSLMEAVAAEVHVCVCVCGLQGGASPSKGSFHLSRCLELGHAGYLGDEVGDATTTAYQSRVLYRRE